MKMKAILAGGILALGLGTAAQAATCTIDNVNFTLDTAAGVTCVSGNDLGANGIVATDKELFNLTGWILGDSTDAVGDNLVQFDDAPTEDATSGIWSLLNPPGYNGYDPLMIVLKSGPQYAAFLITAATSGLSGTWSITETKCRQGVCRDTPKELSHSSLYHQPAPIPLPAAGFLLLGALGGLGLMRRKKA